MDGQPFRLELAAQAGNDVAVDLDHVQMIEPVQQRPRQRAEPRSDLDHRIVASRGDGGHDVVDDDRILQKILPEAFFRNMSGHGYRQRK